MADNGAEPGRQTGKGIVEIATEIEAAAVNTIYPLIVDIRFVFIRRLPTACVRVESDKRALENSISSV